MSRLWTIQETYRGRQASWLRGNRLRKSLWWWWVFWKHEENTETTAPFHQCVQEEANIGPKKCSWSLAMARRWYRALWLLITKLENFLYENVFSYILRHDEQNFPVCIYACTGESIRFDFSLGGSSTHATNKPWCYSWRKVRPMFAPEKSPFLIWKMSLWKIKKIKVVQILNWISPCVHIF